MHILALHLHLDIGAFSRLVESLEDTSRDLARSKFDCPFKSLGEYAVHGVFPEYRGGNLSGEELLDGIRV